MVPTYSSRRYSSNGSFLTTIQAIHTMETLAHNFKGGPNLVREGEQEYNTIKQDSSHPHVNSTILKKLSLTPYLQSVRMGKESFAKSTLLDLTPHICNTRTTTYKPFYTETNPTLTSICRPILRTTESKSLLALAKALVSLQRGLERKGCSSKRHELRVP